MYVNVLSIFSCVSRSIGPLESGQTRRSPNSNPAVHNIYQNTRRVTLRPCPWTRFDELPFATHSPPSDISHQKLRGAPRAGRYGARKPADDSLSNAIGTKSIPEANLKVVASPCLVPLPFSPLDGKYKCYLMREQSAFFLSSPTADTQSK